MDCLKKAIESRYNGVCTITQYQQSEGDINDTVPFITAKNVPCRLSYKSISNTNQTETGEVLTQAIKLFLSPDIVIKAGSKVEVTQNNNTVVYQSAGQPAVYTLHQEIELVLEERWA